MTHKKSSVKLRHDQILINTHQNGILQTLSKYNRQCVCDCDQKCHFMTNLFVITMNYTKDVLNNSTTLRNGQGHLKHVKLHESTLNNQNDT